MWNLTESKARKHSWNLILFGTNKNKITLTCPKALFYIYMYIRIAVNKYEKYMKNKSKESKTVGVYFWQPAAKHYS